MKATTWRLLVAVAVLSFAISWGFLKVWISRGADVPRVPWASALVIGLVGLTVLVAALVLRPRLRRKDGHKPLDPLVAARFAVLSQASSRGGAVFLGAYGALAVSALPNFSIDSWHALAIVCAACVLASILLIVGGLLLERACRLPPPKIDSPVVGDEGHIA